MIVEPTLLLIAKDSGLALHYFVWHHYIRVSIITLNFRVLCATAAWESQFPTIFYPQPCKTGDCKTPERRRPAPHRNAKPVWWEKSTRCSNFFYRFQTSVTNTKIAASITTSRPTNNNPHNLNSKINKSLHSILRFAYYLSFIKRNTINHAAV